jgi:predicted GIY-YIG superfamily endonuclease
VKPFYVYILRCRDGSYYVGHTDNLEKRMVEHTEGLCGGYTARRRPVELVFADEFATREETIERERQLKGWSRLKKEALIRGDWDSLKRLARGPRAPTTQEQLLSDSAKQHDDAA